MSDDIDEYWRRHRAYQAIYEASCQGDAAGFANALDALDRIDVHRLSSHEVAEWFNNRAYVLAQMGAAEEALEHLSEAEELLDGLEGDVPARQHEVLVSCVIGTRGIALLHHGALEDAQTHLEEALALGAKQLTSRDRAHVEQTQWLQAERLWWLALVAEKRGEPVRRADLLRRAAELADTPFGERARAALGG